MKIDKETVFYCVGLDGTINPMKGEDLQFAVIGANKLGHDFLDDTAVYTDQEEAVQAANRITLLRKINTHINKMDESHLQALAESLDAQQIDKIIDHLKMIGV